MSEVPVIKQLLLAPGPTPVPARVRAADGAANHPPSHAAVQRDLRRSAAGSARALRHRAGRAHPRRVRHRRHGSGRRQLLRAGRQGDRRQRRQVRRALGQDGQFVRSEAGRAEGRVGAGGSRRGGEGGVGRAPRCPRRAGAGERDVDHRPAPGRRDRRADPRPATRCWSSTASPPSASTTCRWIAGGSTS